MAVERRRVVVAGLAAIALAAGCSDAKPAATPQTSGVAQMSTEQSSPASPTASSHNVLPVPVAAPAGVVPNPASLTRTTAHFALSDRTAIVAAAPGSQRIADFLAAILRRSTGYQVPVTPTGEPGGNIVLDVDAAVGGDEGYVIDVTSDAIRITAAKPAGLFYAAQTLRQLLPPQIESATPQSTVWSVPGGRIEDRPTYAWRGAMLDVSRHFFDVASVKKYIDDIALYKMNVLHLHLSDDQGWRIQIDAWPKLTEIGGRSEVGGGPGGFYSKADYAEIVAYAQERFVTIVPEIDLPGHTNAALSAYAELNCDGKATKPYTGTEVGFSSVCVTSEATYRFVTDVVTELAAMTPGEYIHIGGDEVQTLSDAEYASFVERIGAIVTKAGKKTIGWAEIGAAKIAPETVVQYWNSATSNDDVRNAVARGASVLMSPADKSYLDMKYDDNTETGLKWAGLIEVKDAWDWDPAAYFDDVPAERIIGVEAPIWSETLKTIEDVEFLAFPRLPAVAEVGWSGTAHRDWADFRTRLASQAPRWKALGISYYASPQIDWPK